MQNRSLKFVATLLASVLVLWLVGCGPKAIKPKSVLDTPDNHFNQGMRELDRGNLDLAVQEFERAKSLDPKYAEAYAGLALVHATKQDFQKAMELVDQALAKNKNSLEARIIKGRIITMRRKGDDWMEEAVKEFKKAAEQYPSSDKPLYFMGITYKEGYDFGQAAAAFAKVIEMKGNYAAAADKEWALVQKIQRAAPGTKVGAKIALITEISRADLAVLLMEELKLMELLEKKRAKTYDTGFRPPEDVTKMAQPEAKLPDVTDIDGHWAKNWIKDIVAAQGMDVFPDHTFRPDEKITRANYAKIMQDIMILATGDQRLATKFIGEASPFPDVNPSHWAFNSIMLMVSRGIMAADKMTGEFRLNDHMSGADALLAIRDFQNAMRITF